MGRPKKDTIDYFPHYAYQGKTMLILQNEFGNDGYAFWYRLLELLCKTEKQVYDYNNPAAWRLLLAETHVKEEIALNILKVLADVDAIDVKLYQNKQIWVQNLVDNLVLVYNRRSTGKPQKPNLKNNVGVNIIRSNANNKPVNANKNGINVNKGAHTIQYNTIQDNNILAIFDYWNNQNIIIHKKLNGNESTIKTALNNYSLEELKTSIGNYAAIVNAPTGKYYWTHKWTLKDFLKRGIDKFMDLKIAQDNYSNKQEAEVNDGW
jgi:hypothetical protein